MGTPCTTKASELDPTRDPTSKAFYKWGGFDYDGNPTVNNKPALDEDGYPVKLMVLR